MSKTKILITQSFQFIKPEEGESRNVGGWIGGGGEEAEEPMVRLWEGPNMSVGNLGMWALLSQCGARYSGWSAVPWVSKKHLYIDL